MEHRHSSQAVGGQQANLDHGGHQPHGTHGAGAAPQVAAGALAFAGVVLSPAAGAVLMSASMIVVALNAQLLRRLRLDPAAVS